MRQLNGSELAGFIKERQARQVRTLRQSQGVIPTLVILKPAGNPVIDTYVRLKQRYAEDISVECRAEELADDEMPARIDALNADDSVHGIIVQLPLVDPTLTDAIVKTIDPKKDVDGLGSHAFFTSATATAIDWLLTGYNVDLKTKSLTIVGNGRLVGAPLAELWRQNGLKPEVLDITTTDLIRRVHESDVIVTATGTPGLITASMLKPKAVIVDAGTTSENGQIVGDVAPDVRERDDLTITPEKGGVGPLTIAVLLDNVIKVASATVSR